MSRTLRASGYVALTIQMIWGLVQTFAISPAGPGLPPVSVGAHAHFGMLSYWPLSPDLRSSDTYRFQTMSHPNLDRYWTWMEAPSTGYSLTPTAARVWYDCDGTLRFGGSSDVPQVVFTATADAKRAAIRQLLAQRGFQPMEWQRRVALPHEKTKPWLK